MNAVFQAAVEIQDFFQARQWPFCIIGGLAALRWGEPRMTQDVDVSLFTDFGHEEQYVSDILHNFQPRIPDALPFALRNRVLLLTTSNGTALDVSLAGLPFEQAMMARASCFAYAPDCSLRTCSAEDLIILKAFADRAKDWMDVESIIMRQGTALDSAYIIEHLTPLCELKDAPDIVQRFRRLIRQ